MRTMSPKMENINKDIKIIMKDKIEILELKKYN